MFKIVNRNLKKIIPVKKEDIFMLQILCICVTLLSSYIRLRYLFGYLELLIISFLNIFEVWSKLWLRNFPPKIFACFCSILTHLNVIESVNFLLKTKKNSCKEPVWQKGDFAGWTNRQAEEWTDGQINGRTDGPIAGLEELSWCPVKD